MFRLEAALIVSKTDSMGLVGRTESAPFGSWMDFAADYGSKAEHKPNNRLYALMRHEVLIRVMEIALQIYTPASAMFQQT